MVPYDKLILNKLLDTYESSSLSRGENERTIHIEVRFTKAFLPAYFDESSGEYEKIHLIMQQLEDQKLLQILWKANKKGHVILKVRLNVEEVDRAYAYVKRVPKANRVADNIAMLEEMRKQTDTPVRKTFIEYLLARLRTNKPVKEFIQLDDLEETQKLLLAVQAVENNKKQLYLREFSIVTFQDSKIFEQMVGKVHRIFCRFDNEQKSKDLAEWLSEHNIYQTPNFVYLKGEAGIRIREEEMSLSVFKQGLGVSGADIDEIEILKTTQIEKVVTIENLTTYFRWNEPDSLMIYLGGYHNAIRRNLLKKVYAAFPEAGYYHFGDIDAGGFEIYRDLCEKTGIPFQMYYMNLDILRRYEKYGKPLTDHDRKRLEAMQGQEDLQELIAYMLEHNVKLEQECIGII
ncbi:MAG: DUF2220 family protein [Lachnospiraceae bacterium]|nr:DUF2220 family protein [Lachnospiraceae bacterium]